MGTKTKMSKLKNTFGLPESLIRSVKQIHEKELSPKQKEIAKLSPPEHKIDAGDFKKLRNRHNPDLEPETKEKQSFKTESSAEGWKAAEETSKTKMKAQSAFKKQIEAQPPASKTPTVMKMGEETLNEIGDTAKGQQALTKYAVKASAQDKLKTNISRQVGIHRAIKKLAKAAKPINASYESNENLIEAPTYPYKANEIAPLLVMLRTVVNFLSSTPALKRIMKEETGLDSEHVDSFIEFLEVLDEEIELAEKKHKDDSEEDEECSPKKPIK